MKVDSLRSHVAVIVILLLSASCFVKTANEKEVKNTCMKSEKTRNGKKCVGKLYSLTEALGRSAELPVNSQVCRLHWDEIRHQNNRCLCPMAKHPKGLHPNSIPPRFYRVFDSVGSQLEGYRPGTRWCNTCAANADRVFSDHPLYTSRLSRKRKQVSQKTKQFKLYLYPY